MIQVKTEVLILILTLALATVRIMEALVRQLFKKPKEPVLTPEQNMMLEVIYNTQKELTKLLEDITLSIEKVSILIDIMLRKK